MTSALFLGLMIAGGGYPRWVVPLIPFLSLLAGFVLSQVVTSYLVLGLLVLMMVFPNLVRIVKFDYLLTLPDTRTLAKSWVEENIPAGTSIVIEGTARDEIPSYLGPPLVLGQGRLREELVVTQQGGQEGLTLQAQLEAYQNRIGYDLTGVPRIDVRYDSQSGKYLSLPNAQYYKDHGVEYVIRSGWVRQEAPAMSASFLESFAQDYVLVQSFRPSVAFRYDFHTWYVDNQALDQITLLTQGKIGPEISIYRFKGTSEK